MMVILVGSIVLTVALVWMARGVRLGRPWAKPAALAFHSLLGAGIVAGTVFLLTDDDGHGDVFSLMGAVVVLAIPVAAATSLLRRRPQ
jgi:hypothetical protein